MKTVLTVIAICVGLLFYFQRSAERQADVNNAAREIERRNETLQRIEDNTPDPDRSDAAVLERLCRQAGLGPDCATNPD